MSKFPLWKADIAGQAEMKRKKVVTWNIISNVHTRKVHCDSEGGKKVYIWKIQYGGIEIMKYRPMPVNWKPVLFENSLATN